MKALFQFCVFLSLIPVVCVAVFCGIVSDTLTDFLEAVDEKLL